MKIIAHWLWFRDRLRTHKDHECRSGSAPADALSVGPTHAKFASGLAPTRVTDAMEKLTSGRLASPRKGGAGLYVAGGMSRDATQELGWWRSPELLEKGEASEMSVALKRASRPLAFERFVKESEEEATLVGENNVGLASSGYTRQFFAHFVQVPDLLSLELVAQMRPNFLSLLGRRARACWTWSQTKNGWSVGCTNWCGAASGKGCGGR